MKKNPDYSIYGIDALSGGVCHCHSDQGNFWGAWSHRLLRLTLQNWRFVQFGESHAAKLMPQPGLEICIKAAGRGGGFVVCLVKSNHLLRLLPFLLRYQNVCFNSFYILAPQRSVQRSQSHPLIAFQHLSLYIQKQLSQSVAVCGSLRHYQTTT